MYKILSFLDIKILIKVSSKERSLLVILSFIDNLFIDVILLCFLEKQCLFFNVSKSLLVKFLWRSKPKRKSAVIEY
jgi:hypothetical protein